MCADCREIVFLAAPAQDATPAAVSIAPPKTHRRWFPVWLPWAATAAILISATFLLTRNGSDSQSKETAKLHTQAPGASAEKVPAQPTLPSETSTQPSAGQSKTKSVPSGTIESPTSTAVQGDISDAVRERDSRESQETKNSNVNDALAKKAESADAPSKDVQAGLAAAAAPTAEYARRNAQLKPGPAAPVQNQLAQNQQQNQVAQNRALSATETVEVSSAAPQVAPTPGRTAAFEAAAGASSKAKVASRWHWRISADGAVERTSAGLPWTTALRQPGAKFTIVAVIGDTIWAGGTHAALFRTDDSGAHWTQIQLPGIASNSDEAISTIDFRDAQNGTVSTSAGRAWTTSDGGASWRTK